MYIYYKNPLLFYTFHQVNNITQKTYVRILKYLHFLWVHKWKKLHDCKQNSDVWRQDYIIFLCIWAYSGMPTNLWKIFLSYMEFEMLLMLTSMFFLHWHTVSFGSFTNTLRRMSCHFWGWAQFFEVCLLSLKTLKIIKAYLTPKMIWPGFMIYLKHLHKHILNTC